ncbi:hypothetical protein PoB_004130900 [Plakobranchus ocellatus]|uniref:Uncharacterized protein n=1 Tax=Plakobranchus ocellatus TaxID=259542 RepID=A0AAV4B8Y3_9GAST|nr:hypothetical protein PoB_004130900 [Plakobranchus ocellatus]
MGNPLIEDSLYLFSIDFQDIMSEEVVKTVRAIKSLGQQQHSNFIEELFVKREKPMTNRGIDLLMLCFLTNNHGLPTKGASVS